MELKLTNVSRASLEELRRDCEDFLRQRNLPLWDRNDPRRADLITRRPATADAVAQWAREVKTGLHGQSGQNQPSGEEATTRLSTSSTSSMPSTYPEIAANGMLALIAVACSLLDRQLAAQAAAFKQEGGFTERLYRERRRNRQQE